MNRQRGKQDMAYPYKGILFGLKKGWSTDACYHTDERWKHTKGKKPDPENHILCDSIRMKCPEWVDFLANSRKCDYGFNRLFTIKKEGNADTRDNVDKHWGSCAKWNTGSPPPLPGGWSGTLEVHPSGHEVACSPVRNRKLLSRNKQQTHLALPLLDHRDWWHVCELSR